jgi:hypothetical protein
VVTTTGSMGDVMGGTERGELPPSSLAANTNGGLTAGTGVGGELNRADTPRIDNPRNEPLTRPDIPRGDVPRGEVRADLV